MGSDTKIAITDLPIRTWTNNYKEMLETMLNGSEKVKQQISDYNNYSGDYSVHFEVVMTQEDKRKAELQSGLHAFFKLQTPISTSSMVLFDKNGCIKRYDDVKEILQEFFELRLEYYKEEKTSRRYAMGRSS